MMSTIKEKSIAYVNNLTDNRRWLDDSNTILDDFLKIENVIVKFLLRILVKMPLILGNKVMHSLNGNISFLQSAILNGLTTLEPNIDSMTACLMALMNTTNPSMLLFFRSVCRETIVSHPWDEALSLEPLDEWIILMKSVFENMNEDENIHEFIIDRVPAVQIFQNMKDCWIDFLNTNAGAHMLNGNGPEVELGEERNHIVAPANALIESQSFEVNHKVEWSAGDRLLNGISDLFAPETRTRTISDSFKTCKEEGLDIMSFLTSKETILVFVVAALLIFNLRPNSITRNVLIVSLGAIALFSATYQSIQGLDLVNITTLISEVKNFTFEEDQKDDIEMVEAQSFNLETPIVSNFLMVALSMMAGYQVKKSFVQGLVSATKVTETQTSNITSLILTVSSSIHDYLESISQHGLAKYFEIADISDDRVTNFQSKVFSFVSSFNAGNPESMLYCGDVYKELYEEGRTLSRSLDKKSFDYRVVSDCTTKLLSVNSKISDMKISLSGERIEPVGILLKGSPATLKGVLAKRLAKVVAAATIPIEWRPAYKQDSKDFFFSVPNDKFWDSYSNKAWVAFFDDIFQRRDAVADSDADALKVIGMVNSAPYCLQMAKVEQKNNVFFRSAFLLATSNLTAWSQINSVTDVSAVQRRFHIEVDVSVNKKYLGKDLKIDYSKLPMSAIEDSLSLIHI